MAYKNQKKNKAHQAELRKKNSHYKHEKKRMRYAIKHPPKKKTIEDYEMLLRQQGLI
jgi:hypothetical protein